ncbi:MAG: hypothetical protein ACE5R6_13240 [Candidatus Heimdallarchaeota archaeon]
MGAVRTTEKNLSESLFGFDKDVMKCSNMDELRELLIKVFEGEEIVHEPQRVSGSIRSSTLQKILEENLLSCLNSYKERWWSELYFGSHS